MANNLTPKEEFLLNPVTEHNITDAAIASFETNFKHPLKVTMPITPTQDLHGMPNPYPAGGSVNLIPDGTDTENGYVAGQYLVTDGTTTANTNYYVSEYFQISENTTYTWSNRVNTSVSPAICFYDENKTFISGININGQYSQTFTSPVGAVYCRSSQTTYTYQEASSVNAAYQLEVGETATEYRRYSNICPISGQDGANVRNTRKDILDDYKPLSYGTLGSCIYAAGPASTGAMVTTSGDICGVYNYIDCSMYRGKQITINYRPVGPSQSGGVAFYDANKSFLYNGIKNSSTTGGTFTFTVPDNQDVVYLRICVQYTKRNEIMMWAEEETQTFPISWQTEAGTVYGGSLTLNEDGSADLVSKWKLYNLSGRSYYTISTGVKNKAINFRLGVSASNTIYKGSAKAISDTYHFYGYSQTSSFSNPDRMSVGVWLYWQIDNIVYIVLPVDAEISGYLAVELKDNLCTSYHFPNVGQLKAFLGQNNVYSDIGNVNVKYLTQNSQTGIEYRGDRALELRRRAMIADSPHIHTTVGSSETGGLASFKSYIKAPVKKIEIPFSPKQDFNGYDFPWPGGGYVQLFNSATTTYGSKIDVDGTLTEDANYFVSDFIPVTASTYYYVSSEMPVVVGYNSSKEFLQVIKNSGTGGAFQTPENCAYVRIQNYTEESNASMQASAAGTAYVCKGSEENQWYPYENICPIEGYDGCKIKQCRKNLLDMDLLCKGAALSVGNNRGTLTYNANNKVLTFQSTITGTYNFECNVYPLHDNVSHIISENDVSYVLSYDLINAKPNSSGYLRNTVYFSNGTEDSLNVKIPSGTGTYSRQITIPANSYITRIKFFAGYTGTFFAGNTVTFSNFMLERGNEETEYEDVIFNTLPLTFNQSGDHSFLPIQDGSGDPSPENVRPIRPGLTFTRDDDSVLSVYGGTLTVNDDGTGSIKKLWHDFSNVMRYDQQFELKINGTKIANYYNQGSLPYSPICDKFSTEHCIASGNQFIFDPPTPEIAALTGNDKINAFKDWLYDNPLQLIAKINNSASQTIYTLSVTETNRALEALGLTQHIGTLYGGTVTINPDGSADVVSDLMLYNLGDLTYSQYATTNHCWTLQVPGVKLNATDYEKNLLSCDIYKVLTTRSVLNDGEDKAIWMYASTGNARLIIRDENYIINGSYDVNALKASLDGVYACFIRQTPQTYHFSNLEQLKVWLGENNFWCDISDDITVKYLNRG